MMNHGLCYLIIAVLLASAGCSHDVDQLLTDLESDDATIRMRATTKLSLLKKDAELTDKIAGLLTSDNERTVLIAVQLLGTTDSTVVEPLGKTIKHSNPAIREFSAQSLGLIGSTEAVPYLVDALADSVPAVRYMAVKMLGNIGHPSAVDHLYPMFRDNVDSICVETIQTLHKFNYHSTADIHAADFAVPVNDSRATVRYAATVVLGESYPDSAIAGELLIERLKDENKHIRKEAIIGLGKHQYTPAAEPLKQIYDFASLEEMLEISEAIKRITGEEYPPPESES